MISTSEEVSRLFLHYLLHYSVFPVIESSIPSGSPSCRSRIRICRLAAFNVNSSKTLDNLPSLFRSTGGRSTELQVRRDSCFNRVKIGRERNVRGHQMRFAFTIVNCGKYLKRHHGLLSQYDDRCDSSPAHTFTMVDALANTIIRRERTAGPISRVLHRIGLIRPVASYRRAAPRRAVACFDELARITRV